MHNELRMEVSDSLAGTQLCNSSYTIYRFHTLTFAHLFFFVNVSRGCVKTPAALCFNMIAKSSPNPSYVCHSGRCSCCFCWLKMPQRRFENLFKQPDCSDRDTSEKALLELHLKPLSNTEIAFHVDDKNVYLDTIWMY